MAVEALEGVEHGLTHRRRQPQPPGQAGADLAVGTGPFGLEPGHASRTAQHPQAFGIHAKVGQEPQGLRGYRRVDQVAAGADGDVITAERPGDLVRRRGAADKAEQRPVVNLGRRM